MTATMTDEYRQLGYDTSNDMIRYDARWGDGKYPEAALHIRNAGLGRIRMGQTMFDAGEFSQAAADWLSAAACFLLVPDLERMREALGRAQKLDREGKIPPERRDIHAALGEREKELEELEQKLTQFRQECARRKDSPGALEWLLRQVRELPGYPKLHAEISGQAFQLGQRPIAVESLAWARKFDPSSPDLAGLQASQLFAFGNPVGAAALAREVLAAHPDMDSVRFILAQALAFRAGPNVADWKASDYEAAIEELQPLFEKRSADAVTKLLALALATLIHHGLGHGAEYLRLLAAFDQLAQSIPSLANVAAQVRRSTPQIFPQPGSNGTAYSATERPHSAAEPDYSTARSVFEQFSPFAGASTQ